MTPFRATAALGTGSMVALLAGAVAAKIVATLEGPGGVGTVGVLTSVLSLTGIAGGFGVAVLVIRSVAADRSDASGVRTTTRVARFTVLISSGLVALVMVAGRDWIATVPLGGLASPGDVILIAAALIFQSLAGVEAAVINGLHRVSVLATSTAIAGVVAAICLIGAVVVGGTSAIAAGMLVGAIGSWGLWVAAATRSTPTVVASVERPWSAVLQTARDGAPFALSQFVGTGAQLLIPFIVLFVLDPTDVGLYRAAATISVAYLAFLLAAMGQDYLPRLAAAPKAAIADVVHAQLDLLLRIAVPAIVTTYALAPWIIQLLYSQEFSPAVPLLRWFLIGDLIKLCSWSISFVILARAPSRRFLVVELVAGLTLVSLTVIGLPPLGLVGAGVAYAITYAVYFGVVHLASGNIFDHRVSRHERLTISLACAMAVLQLVADPQDVGATVTLLGIAALLGVILIVRPLIKSRRRPAADMATN